MKVRITNHLSMVMSVPSSNQMGQVNTANLRLQKFICQGCTTSFEMLDKSWKRYFAAIAQYKHTELNYESPL